MTEAQGDMPSAPPTGRCAIHPDRPAQGTCARCGDYMCAPCSKDAATGLCLTCHARTGPQARFPYDRERFTLDGLLTLALSRWKQHWKLFTALTALYFGVTWSLSLLGTLVSPAAFVTEDTAPSLSALLAPAFVLQSLLQQLVQLVLQLVLLGACVDVLEGRTPTTAELAARLSRVPACILATLIIYSVVLAAFGGVLAAAWAAGGLLSFGPGFWVLVLSGVVLVPLSIYAGLGVMFVNPILVHEPHMAALPALRASWAVVSGRRMVSLGIAIVAGLIGIAGMFACCVGVLVSMPLGMLLYTGLYLALATPAAERTLGSPQWPV